MDPYMHGIGCLRDVVGSLICKIGATDRQFRLFTCACVRLHCRRFHVPDRPFSRFMDAIAIAERWADGELPPPDVYTRYRSKVLRDKPRSAAIDSVRHSDLLGDYVWFLEEFALSTFQRTILRMPLGEETYAIERGHVASEWITPTVQDIAEAIYRDRCYVELPILADALIDGGVPEEVPCEYCDGRVLRRVFEEIDAPPKACVHCNLTGLMPNRFLSHLRAPGPHERGCWVLDLILGKGFQDE